VVGKRGEIAFLARNNRLREVARKKLTLGRYEFEVKSFRHVTAWLALKEKVARLRPSLSI
jgi:hypothetical protein